MKYHFEINNSKKKVATDKSIYCLQSIVTKKGINKRARRLKDGGFVAWPENIVSTIQQCANIESLPSWLQSGGYVAYPKNKSFSTSLKKSKER